MSDAPAPSTDPITGLSVCGHASVMPTIKDADLGALSPHEVRAKYPRFMGACPSCGEQVILYASLLHYVAGDY